MNEADVVALDTETFYTAQYSLRKMPLYEYIRDDRFKCYLVSAGNDEFSVVTPPEAMDWTHLDGASVVAHNALFDRLVFEHMQEHGVVPANIRPKEWICTADMAAYFRVKRSLDSASEHLLGKPLSKDTRDKMKGKVLTDVVGTPLYDELLTYGKRDETTCFELFKTKYSEWPTSERLISQLSRDCGIEGVNVDVVKLDAGIDELSTRLFEAEKNIPWEWDPTKTPLAAEKIREECNRAGIRAPLSFDMKDEDCKKWEDEFADTYPWIKAIRDWRRINSKLKKLNTMKRGLHNGRFSYALKYFGAATGRWSGSEKFNMQNLDKETVFGVNLRELIIADEGDTLVIADFAQIEPRVLQFMAGNHAMLDMIRKGFGVYQAHAVSTMGWDSTKDLKTCDKHIYALSKARCLGLGFSAGHVKFQGLAKIYGVDLTLEEAKKTVDDFRASNPEITGLWRLLNQAMKYSAERLGDADFTVTLHSGRKLVYSDLINIDRIGYHAYFFKGDSNRRKIYGGLLTENMVQALSRDILVDAWIRLYKAGYKILFTCHDEIVMSVRDDAELPGKIANIKAIMRQEPEWVQGLPLDVELVTSKCYTK